MRKFHTSNDGVTITDEAHGVKSVTHLTPAEAEQKRNWLGAMGYEAPAADAPAAEPKAAKPKAAKSKPAKKSRGKK